MLGMGGYEVCSGRFYCAKMSYNIWSLYVIWSFLCSVLESAQGE